MEDGDRAHGHQPERVPDEGKIDKVLEPVVRATILAPSEFIGSIMELCQTRRGTLLGMDYLSEDRVEIRYTLPARRDRLRLLRPAEVQDPRLRLAGLRAHRRAERRAGQGRHPAARRQGRRLLRHHAQGRRRTRTACGWSPSCASSSRGSSFEVPIQAAIGSRVIARETIRAIRKDVLAKCYGGDISRKRKLLEKQKEGKKRMKMVGRVEVPQEAFIAVLSTDDGGDGQGEEVAATEVARRSCASARRASRRRARASRGPRRLRHVTAPPLRTGGTAPSTGLVRHS